MTMMTKEGGSVEERSDSWAVAKAKARFSEVVDRARTVGPQVITRNDRATAIVVSIEEWDRKTKRQGTLAEFFATSPLRGADIVIERTTDGPRDLEW